MITFTDRTTRWTVAILVLVVVLLAALAVELRNASVSPPPAKIGGAETRDHRDADTPAALSGPRRRAKLAPCP
ncbi:MAG: TlpA family protein disulfide reductase, partial [Mycobacterium sp.]